MPPSIAIVGGGPAGLTLARLLQQSPTPINITIFEHDASPHARFQQGGTLDLHVDSGLKALKAMGLEDVAKPHLRYEGEELVIADRNGCELVHMREAAGVGERASAPEIDREKLVGMLLGAVGEDNVQWGSHLKRVDAEKGMLEFADGRTEGPFDLVVGADGAWSKVRQLLTEARPQYSGVGGIEAHIERPEEWPRVDKLVGRGSYFAFGGGRSLMAQRQGDNSIKVGIYLKRDEEFFDELSPGDEINEDSLRPKLLAEYQDWTPELREWIAISKLTQKWKLWELPVGTTWEHRPGYTLVGDSAHLCTPFAGLGANAAMRDSLELAELIIRAAQNGESLDDAVVNYEKAMFPRAKKVQLDTMRNKTNGFSENAPINFVSSYIAVFGEEMGWPLDKGLLYWMPISKTVYSTFWIQTRLYAAWKWLIGLFPGRHRRLAL